MMFMIKLSRAYIESLHLIADKMIRKKLVITEISEALKVRKYTNAMYSK